MTHTDDLLEAHEAELRDLLERTMSETTTPAEIGPHALRHGRRLRSRRRVGIATGAVAASVAAALILPTALGGGATSVTDPAGSPSSSATEPTQEPLPAERPAGWWDMPATDMVSTVEAILPDGVTVTSPGPLTADSPDAGPAIGWINPTVTGPSGPGRVNVMLDPYLAYSVEPSTRIEAGETIDVEVLPIDDGDISCPGNLVPRAQCTELEAADGTVIGRHSSTTFGDVVILEVVLRRDGGTVYAAAVNSLDPKPGRQSPASAETPPLTLDQLEDLVRNDTWVMPAT